MVLLPGGVRGLVAARRPWSGGSTASASSLFLGPLIAARECAPECECLGAAPRPSEYPVPKEETAP